MKWELINKINELLKDIETTDPETFYMECYKLKKELGE